MGIGDHQLDPAQPAPREAAQELGPERLGLGGADLHAQHLAHPQVSGVDPQIGPVALDGALQEGLHPLIDLGAQARDLARGDAAHAHSLHQAIDRARRDALHVGFLDHRRERLLGRMARLQEEWEVAARAQLRDAQRHRAGTCPRCARGSHCASWSALHCVRHALHHSGWPLPAPSGAGPRSRSCRARCRRHRPSRAVRKAASCLGSSGASS